MNFEVQKLPPASLEETRAILKKLTSAHRYLAELKGVAATIPNQTILINTLVRFQVTFSDIVKNGKTG
ncbi:MAG: hypothetical protein OHK0052_27460 [Anaerolineales bacterium]